MKNCSNEQLFKSYDMRGTKLVFCRERNIYVKNKNNLGFISLYFTLKMKNGIVEIAAGKKNQIVQITTCSCPIQLCDAVTTVTYITRFISF